LPTGLVWIAFAAFAILLLTGLVGLIVWTLDQFPKPATTPGRSLGSVGNDCKGKYPDPEGWARDGFWRDSSIDSDYETGLNGAVRPAGGGKGDRGSRYWAGGKDRRNSPDKLCDKAGFTGHAACPLVRSPSDGTQPTTSAPLSVSSVDPVDRVSFDTL
jgi:hypothetical protein